jgi:(p)ppGpp synthase/HD superfamily hydrolase
MSIIYQAMIFAKEVHKQQRRKYTHNPYFEHLAEVAGIVASVFDLEKFKTQWYIAIAWLHDCIEDCAVTHHDLVVAFNEEIAEGVLALSDLEDGNRALRKQLSRERLAECGAAIQTIKVADLISNTGSIVYHDPEFAKTYLEEKRLLLDVLTKADKRLVTIAREQCLFK